MGFLHSSKSLQHQALPPRRPQPLSYEAARAEVQASLDDCNCDTAKAEFIKQQWKSFVERKRDLDQIWIFESYSCGPCHRKGLALERDGYVVTVLLFPYW